MLFPISSETYIRRVPLLTLSLIGINFIVFFVTYPIMRSQESALMEITKNLRQQEYSIYLRHMDEFGEIKTSGNVFAVLDSVENLLIKKNVNIPEEEYSKWKKLFDQYNDKKNKLFVSKWGFNPKKFSIITLITSLFLHGGWMHIIGNMWFLWLVGVNIEDSWGRPFFLGFYILSGIIASLFFMIFNNTNVHLIGASGAIAGLMGVFTIKFFKNRIKFLLVLFPFFVGVVSVFAGFVFPFWFIEQLLYAIYVQGSNVAFWAHVGGFSFGVITVVLLKTTGFEKAVLEKGVDNTIDSVDTSFRKAIEMETRGDIDTAIGILEEYVKDNPNNLEALQSLGSLYLKKGLEEKAAHYFRKALNYIIRSQNYIGIIQFYIDYIKSNKLDRYLTPGESYRIAEAYKKNNDIDSSIYVLLQSYKFNRDSKEAPLILLRLIKTLVEAGRIDKAKYAFNELATRFPRYIEQGKLYLKGGQYDI